MEYELGEVGRDQILKSQRFLTKKFVIYTNGNGETLNYRSDKIGYAFHKIFPESVQKIRSGNMKKRFARLREIE